MTAAEIAYVAGIIDTGGTVSVHVTKGRGTRDRGRVYVIPLLKVANTHEAQIRFLHTVCGGSMYGESARNAYKPQWGWALTGDAATALLTLVRPHLHVKRKIAGIVLAGAQRKARGTATQAHLKQWVDSVRALHDA